MEAAVGPGLACPAWAGVVDGLGPVDGQQQLGGGGGPGVPRRRHRRQHRLDVRLRRDASPMKSPRATGLEPSPPFPLGGLEETHFGG